MSTRNPDSHRIAAWQHIVHWPGLRMPLRTWIAYCLTFLVAFLGIDYFSAKKLNLPISAEKFNQYFSLAYPHCMSERTCIWNFAPATKAKEEDREVSVILWTDAGLKRDENVVWPIRMETHAAVLDSILRYNPKAVFVDILFVDDPAKRGDDSIGDLVDTIEEYRKEDKEKKKTPIFFSDPNNPPAMSVVKALQIALHEDNLIPVTLKSGSTQITYPSEAPPHPGGDSGPRANGAVAIYRSMMLSRGKTNSKKEAMSGDFHLFWGGRTSEINERVWQNCHQIDMPETFHGILFQALREIAESVFVSDDESADSWRDAGNICTYTPALPADIFVDIPACAPYPKRPDDSKNSTDTKTTPGPETTPEKIRDESCIRRTSRFLEKNLPGIHVDDLTTVITNKYVVYGASFEGTSDIYKIPIYDGKGLSGVFVHAMALDNLLEMDGDVPTAQTGRTAAETLLYYFIAVPLSVFSFVLSGYLIFSVWHAVDIRLRVLIERYALRVVLWRRRPHSSAGTLEEVILKVIRLSSLLVEILYHGLVIVFIGGLVLFCTWLVFLNSTIGVINWTAVLLSSGVLSIWTKTPLAEGLVDFLFERRRPSSNHRVE